MALRDIANEDLREIINDSETGGALCTITAPDESTEDFRVPNNHIHLAIDPGTGEVVTGMQSSVAVLTNELVDAGFEAIRGVEAADSKPWLVTISDVLDRPYTFKVAESYPDHTIGLTVLILEYYSS